MGNQSKSNGGQKTTYITDIGYEVDADGYDESFMNKMNKHIAAWLRGTFNDSNIIYNMSKDEIHYLINHMQLSDDESMVPTGHLTRLELKYHAEDIKEGDILKGNNLFRSFSRVPSSSEEILHDLLHYSGQKADAFVIFRTVGKTPFFDPSKFSNPFPSQTEVFVPVDAMRVEKIHTLSNANEVSKLTGIHPNIPKGSNIKVIDITPDSNVKNIPVILFEEGKTTINYNPT